VLIAVAVIGFAGVAGIGVALALWLRMVQEDIEAVRDRLDGILQVIRESEAVLPEVGDWLPHDVLLGLLVAVRVEHEKQWTKGRPRSFSRRTLNDTLGWTEATFRTFVNALEEQGYIVRPGERQSIRWTAKGRLLLYQVRAGRFSDVGDVNLYDTVVR
jgi:hypothetical protein